MKKNILIISFLLFTALSFAQRRPIRTDVIKHDQVTTTERDSYVVPLNQVWYITLTDGTKQKNIGGAGWVVDGGSGLDPTDQAKLDNLSGTNTGDQDLSGKADIDKTTANSITLRKANGNSGTNYIYNIVDTAPPDTEAYSDEYVNSVSGTVTGNNLFITLGRTNLSDLVSAPIALPSSSGGGVTDHGALTGLTDDDHPQYFNQTRGDARYLQIEVDGSPTNEIQTLSQSGNTISLTSGGSVDVSTTTAITANTAKVTNATHTGDVTGSTILTISDNAVTTSKIANGNITGSKITDGTIVASKLALNSVGSSSIIDGNVTSAKLATSSVASSNIIDGTIVAADIATTGVAANSYTNANITVNDKGQITLASNGSAGGLAEITGTASPIIHPNKDADYNLISSTVTYSKIGRQLVAAYSIEVEKVGNSTIASQFQIRIPNANAVYSLPTSAIVDMGGVIDVGDSNKAYGTTECTVRSLGGDSIDLFFESVNGNILYQPENVNGSSNNFFMYFTLIGINTL